MPPSQGGVTAPVPRRTGTPGHAMSVSLQRLLPLFERERAAARAMVLATVAHTAGPTYTKAGAHMLITERGEYAGLLSGGCLEGDLAERASAVLSDGASRMAHYDMRGPDDLLFGLGSGCEGAMDIVLQRLDERGGWQPMTRLASAWRAERPEGLLLVASSGNSALPLGSGVFLDDGAAFGVEDAAWINALRKLAMRQRAETGSRFLAQALPGIDLLALRQPPPTRLLLLGAGPDAQPVAELAAVVGWNVTVVDHRSHYARAARFPSAAAVHEGGAVLVHALTSDPRLPPYAAAVVMSHHLATDLAYLRALADCDIAYIGLLGPAARSERLLADLGPACERLRPRLHAPVGLDIGAATPETIALAIIAEIQAALAARLSPHGHARSALAATQP
jgi:xanthine dehydrogenase accessory factor